MAEHDISPASGDRFAEAFQARRRALDSALAGSSADASSARTASQAGKQRVVTLWHAISEGLVILWQHHVGIRPRERSLRRWAIGLGVKLKRIDPQLVELRRQLRRVRKQNRRLQAMPHSSWPARMARVRRVVLRLRLHTGKLLLLAALLLVAAYLWLVDAPIARQARDLWELIVLGWQS